MSNLTSLALNQLKGKYNTNTHIQQLNIYIYVNWLSSGHLKLQANCEQICWPPSCIRLMGGWACPVIGSSYSTAVGDKLWLEKYRPLLSWSDGWVCFAGPVVAVHGLGWHPLCHALTKTRLGGLNQASQCTFLRKSGMKLFQYK